MTTGMMMMMMMMIMMMIMGDHSYDKRCHSSYVTSFVSVQEEECDENFKKVVREIFIN